MRGKLGDKIRLNHILEAITEIERYLNDADFNTFLDNSMMRFACIKQMEIVGEARNHISEAWPCARELSQPDQQQYQYSYQCYKRNTNHHSHHRFIGQGIIE